MDKKISLFFAGDFCSKPSTSRITVSDELKSLIQACDLSVVNFEVPLRPEGQFPRQVRERFFQNDDAPRFLRDLGFNLFQLANNHAFDWDTEGFLKTKSFLGEDSFGAGTYEEANSVKVVDLNGLKIGFLAVSFAAYKGVFNDPANHEGYGCAYINDTIVNHQIIDAKRGGVDYLFVLPHDGIEYIDVPMPETIARYRDFIDFGADGVIGTHPHCPQGWEEYKGKPIFYSLGNFLFNSKKDYEFKADKPHWYEGLCAKLSIEDGVLSWEVFNTRNVDNLEIVVDHSEEREKHNTLICKYLRDKEAYREYLGPVIKKQVDDDIQVLEHVMYPQTFVGAVKAFAHFLARKLTKRSLSRDVLWYLIKDDARRNRLLRVMNYELKFRSGETTYAPNPKGEQVPSPREGI